MKKFIVYMSCDYTEFENRNYLAEPVEMNSPEGWAYYESDVDGFSLEDATKYANDVRSAFPNAYVSVDEKVTYDVVFNDGAKSNAKGFNTDYKTCEDYIKTYNGTNESYFEDYKGGIVSVVNSNGDTIYEEDIL